MTLMSSIDEHWVLIDSHPNYVVSNYGQVVNVSRGRELTPSPDKNGYLRIALYKDNVRSDFMLHRLVAWAFFLNYAEGVEVKHIDGNKEDCSVLNLTLGNACRKKEVGDAT